MRQQRDPSPGGDKARLLAAVGADALRTMATESYRGNNDTQSIHLYRRLVDLSCRDGDVRGECDNRFWLGAALHGCGRLLEALAAMAPALDEGAFVGGRDLQSRLLSRFILVAVDVPLPLAQIEAAMAQVERLLERWGWQDLDSRIPLARANLALGRGQADEALRWARIAMARYPRDPATYASHAYLTQLARASLAAGRLDVLRQVMSGWNGHLEVHYETSRRLVANLARAILRLDEGDRDGATALADLACEGALYCSDYRYHVLGLLECARLYLALDRVPKAGPLLARLLRHRHGEVGRDRHAIRMLQGDYHLALAKSMRTGRRGARKAVERRLRAAEAGYRRARREGEAIDALLRCEANRRPAEEGLREVARLR